MIEPDPKDIERNFRSFSALFVQMGGNLDQFVKHISESIAYQQALVKHYKQMLREEMDAGRLARRYCTGCDDLVMDPQNDKACIKLKETERCWTEEPELCSACHENPVESPDTKGLCSLCWTENRMEYYLACLD